MPFYSVLVHGEGIKVPSDNESGPIIGFYATRIVRASSIEQAREVAKAMILNNWTKGSYASANRGSVPRLEIESASRATLWEWLWFKNSNHIFYPDSEAKSDS